MSGVKRIPRYRTLGPRIPTGAHRGTAAGDRGTQPDADPRAGLGPRDVRGRDRGRVRRVVVGGHQHLRVLREAGFVVERRAGTSRIYRTDKAALGSLRSVVEDHWRQGLGRVKDLAEAEQRKKDGS